MTVTRFTEKKLLALINSKLQSHLERQGFQFSSSLKIFRREINGTLDEIRVNVAKRGSEGRIFSVWIYVHFGISEISQMVRKIITRGRDNSNLDIVNIGTDLHNVEPSIIPKSWLIDSQDVEDINNAVILMAKTIEYFGLPFIEKLHDLEILHDILVQNDKLSWQLTGDHQNRCAIIVSIAKITGKIDDPSYYKNLRKNCKESLENSGIDSLDFENFLTSIIST